MRSKSSSDRSSGNDISAVCAREVDGLGDSENGLRPFLLALPCLPFLLGLTPPMLKTSSIVHGWSLLDAPSQRRPQLGCCFSPGEVHCTTIAWKR